MKRIEDKLRATTTITTARQRKMWETNVNFPLCCISLEFFVFILLVVFRFNFHKRIAKRAMTVDSLIPTHVFVYVT